jgi:hypothetical protein
MKEVSERLGHTVLYLIGTKIAHNAILPEGIDSFEVCLEAIDQAYHMNHRGGDIGFYKYSFNGHDGAIRRATMECRNPYPCSFDKGVLEGFSQRFKPDACKDIFIREDEQSNCRKKGHESCFYQIVWT